MTIVLNILLGLALLFLILTTSGGQQGSHEALGSFILILIACLLMSLVLVISTFTGKLDWMPGGRLVQLALSLGVTVCAGVALYYSIAEKGSLPFAAGFVPYLLFVGCALAVNGFGVIVAKVTLGAGALAGWILMGAGLVSWIRQDMRNAEATQLASQDRMDQFTKEQTARYRALAPDAKLVELLGFTWARDETVQREALARVNAWPNLDDELIDLIGHDHPDAIYFVAKVYQKAPARFTPAWAAMMDRQFKEWEPQLLAPNGASWEPNISDYFEGAQKIQKAGGNLKPELRTWYELLKRVKGLEGLAAFIKTLL